MDGKFRIDERTVYSLEALERELGAVGLSARWLIEEVRPPKLARSQWLGSDILAAMREYTKRRAEEAVSKRRRPGRRGRQPKTDAEHYEQVTLEQMCETVVPAIEKWLHEDDTSAICGAVSRAKSDL